jgi:mRNA interferase MazF
MICSRYQIVVVPFPFADMNVAKPRPAVVLSSESFNTECTQTILAMITTATHSRWATDIELQTLAGTGLRVSCVVRFKLFTLANTLISRTIGILSEGDAARLRDAVGSILSA